MTGLLRHVSAERGPVTGVRSTLQPSLFRPLYWYSLAKLSDRFQETFGGRFPAPVSGAGWDADKATSQVKAVASAIERIARAFYHEDDARRAHAGLDLDPTPTGFAAAPCELGRRFVVTRAYHEAVERWALGRWNDDPALGLAAIAGHEGTESLGGLFRAWKGEWLLFSRPIRLTPLEDVSGELAHFVLSVFALADGGIVPGSACAAGPMEAIERAALETYANLRRVDRVRRGHEQLLDRIRFQRLWNFATDARSARRVRDRLVRGGPTGAIPLDASVLLSRGLAGPWLPEVLVHRVVLSGTLPMSEGGIERFVV